MADSICSENQLQRICETVGCSNTAKLQCPTCIKLGIPGSYFCSQDCFKKSWSTHKQQHKKAKGASIYDPWPDFTFSGKLRPWPVTPKRVVPDRTVIGTPHSELAARGTSQILVLSDEDQESLRVACKLGREVLDIGAEAVAVGVTTDEIDRLIHEATIDRDCYPSPLNYYRFPKSCCTSVNEVICHGIPDKRPLTDGDIVNIDVTVYHRGFHGDLNETLLVGNVDDVTKKLVGVTWDCLDYAMQAVKPGMRYRDIGAIIQKHAQANGFSVVRSYCGHGIHRLFHTAPNVPHYAKNKAVGVMKAGHSFTIEPMISEGVWRDMVWPDNWTAVTQDGRRSAQFEHTLLVTDTGVDILTQRPGTSRPHFMDQLG